tara:strand:- start:574 stop:702 length:129 start_codon:yes stop_codon:yes gene_type:complete
MPDMSWEAELVAGLQLAPTKEWLDGHAQIAEKVTLHIFILTR